MPSKKIIIVSLIGLIAFGSLAYVSFLILSPTSTPYKQWLENPTFDTPIEPTWFWTNGSEGDNSDIDATTSPGQINLRVLGEQQMYTLISGTPNKSSSPGWRKVQNGIYQYPDTSIINSQGCYVSHDWAEDTNQFPSVHFRTNVSTNVDMLDYQITSVILDVEFNASVDVNIDTPDDSGGGIDFWEYFGTGDYIEFYAEISDINYIEPYVVAYNRTRYLGQNSPQYTIINNSYLFTYNQSIIIDALNTALDKDPDHSNFTIILGINIYSEDNRQFTDEDDYDDLYIKTCNLTITYEKTVNEFTTVSWNQISDPIEGKNLRISKANFNFKYMIDKLWSETAPLSELRFYINDKLYSEETIKLSSANISFTEAKDGGFDVTSYIDKDIDISISIELFLKETFELAEVLTLSFDDVYLYIKIVEIEAEMNPIVYLLGGAVVGLVVAFGLYFKIFQYPPLVRKIRKLKSKIRKGRKTKPVLITSRNIIVENNFQERFKLLNLETIKSGKIIGIEKEDQDKLIKKEGEVSL